MSDKETLKIRSTKVTNQFDLKHKDFNKYWFEPIRRTTLYTLIIIDGDGRERKYTLNKYSQVVSKIKIVEELCDIKSFTCTNNQLGLNIKEPK